MKKTINIAYDPHCSGPWTKYASLTDQKPGTYMNGGKEYVVEQFISMQDREIKSLNQLESEAIEKAIQENDGDLTKTSLMLGVGRATLYRKIKQYGIEPGRTSKK